MDHRRPNRLQPIRWNYSCGLAFRVNASKRQAKEETRTTIAKIFGGDRTIVRLDDGTHDRQTHPHSLLFGGKEMIEHFLRVIAGKPGAEAAHTHLHRLAVDRTRADDDAALVRRKRFDCI